MALSAEDKAEVQQLVTAGAAAALTSDAGKAVLTELVGTAVGQATTSLTKTLEAISGKVETLATATPPVKPAGGGKDNPKDLDSVAEIVKASIAEALKPVNEQLESQKKEKQAAADAAARDGLIASGTKAAGYSGLASNALFKRFVNGMDLKDEAAVKKAVEEYREVMKAQGFKVEPTAASPEGEGATKPGGSGGGGGGDGKPLSKEEKEKRIKELAASTQPQKVG